MHFSSVLGLRGLKGTEGGGEALEESQDEVNPAETCPLGEPRTQSILENMAQCCPSGWQREAEP